MNKTLRNFESCWGDHREKNGEVEKKEGVEVHRLIFRGVTLNDERSLRSYDVQENDMLIVQSKKYPTFECNFSIHNSMAWYDEKLHELNYVTFLTVWT